MKVFFCAKVLNMWRKYFDWVTQNFCICPYLWVESYHQVWRFPSHPALYFFSVSIYCLHLRSSTLFSNSCNWYTFFYVARFMPFILWLYKTFSPSCVAVRQEQELRNGGAIDKKLTTLADLFRPPIDLMHKGSFETVSC